MASESNSRALVLLLITSGFFITGLLFDYMPMIVDDHIKRTVELATNDEIVAFWSKPPVDVHSYYWLYDVLNAEQFQTSGERIRVRKVGPFHFASRFEKRIIDLSRNKFRITYNTTRYMKLNESYASDLLDKPLTLLNPLFVSIIEGARVSGRQMDAQSRAVAIGSVNKLTVKYNETLFHNVSARQALVGRAAPIIEKLKKIAQTFGVSDQLPELPADGKFGFVALTNGTWSGPFEVYTGYRDTARSLGDLISYKGKRRLDYYEGKCNRLQASVGELRPMPVDGREIVEIFSPNFCRIVRLRPTGQHKMREGQAISYVLARENFMSVTSNPDNKCFCNGDNSISILNNSSLSTCQLDGVLDLAPCSYNSPILMTVSSITPDERITATIHDFDVDMLRGDVDELPPADELTQILVLKRVGVPLKADLTATLFMRIIRDASFKQTNDVPEVSYIPIVSVRETVTIPPKLAQIVINLESFLSLTYHIKVIMYLSAIVLLCWLTGHYYGRSSSASTAPRVESDNWRTRPASGDGEMRVGSASGGTTTGASQQTRMVRETTNNGDQTQAGVDTLGKAPENASEPNGDDEGAKVQQREKEQPLPVAPPAKEAGDKITSSASSSSSSASERANSADSNRSLPPSRHTSRFGSLSQTSEQQASLAAPQNSEQQQQRQSSTAKLFSKVDEERATRRKLKQSRALVSPAAVELRPHAAAAASEQDECGRRCDSTTRKQRKSWFVSACSNLIRMLNGLRSSINDASQLNLNENDAQDKQLEMLAGKFDNWYASAQCGGGGGGGDESLTANSSAEQQQAGNGGNDEQENPKVGPQDEQSLSKASADKGGEQDGCNELVATQRQVTTTTAPATSDEEQQHNEEKKSMIGGELESGAAQAISSGGGDLSKANVVLHGAKGIVTQPQQQQEGDGGTGEPRATDKNDSQAQETLTDATNSSALQSNGATKLDTRNTSENEAAARCAHSENDADDVKQVKRNDASARLAESEGAGQLAPERDKQNGSKEDADADDDDEDDEGLDAKRAQLIEFDSQEDEELDKASTLRRIEVALADQQQSTGVAQAARVVSESESESELVVAQESEPLNGHVVAAAPTTTTTTKTTTLSNPAESAQQAAATTTATKTMGAQRSVGVYLTRCESRANSSGSSSLDSSATTIEMGSNVAAAATTTQTSEQQQQRVVALVNGGGGDDERNQSERERGNSATAAAASMVLERDAIDDSSAERSDEFGWRANKVVDGSNGGSGDGDEHAQEETGASQLRNGISKASELRKEECKPSSVVTSSASSSSSAIKMNNNNIANDDDERLQNDSLANESARQLSLLANNDAAEESLKQIHLPPTTTIKQQPKLRSGEQAAQTETNSFPSGGGGGNGGDDNRVVDDAAVLTNGHLGPNYSATNSAAAATYQQQQQQRKNGDSIEAAGNDILSERIMSHAQVGVSVHTTAIPNSSRLLRANNSNSNININKSSAPASAFNNSNQHTSVETTGNHLHHRLQPARA